MIFTSDLFQLIIALIYFIYEMLAYFVLGSNITRFWPRKNAQTALLTIIVGYFSYYVLFECLALPLKIAGSSLSFLAFSWLAIIFILLGASVLFNRAYLRESVHELLKGINRNKKYVYYFGGLTLLTFVMILSITPETMGVQDDSYYIADIMTSLFTDTIQQHHYANGMLLSRYQINYFIPMYPIHGAVVGRLIQLHPIIENKWCSVLVVLILTNLVYYIFALKVFKGNKKRSFFLLLLTTFFSMNYNLWGNSAGTFFFYRISEGKGILSNLVLPAIFLFYWEADSIKKKSAWIVLIIVVCSGISICMTSVFVIPFLLVGLYGTSFIITKERIYIYRFLVALFPCLLAYSFYELLAKGIVIVPII